MNGVEMLLELEFLGFQAVRKEGKASIKGDF